MKETRIYSAIIPPMSIFCAAEELLLYGFLKVEKILTRMTRNRRKSPIFYWASRTFAQFALFAL